MKKRFLIIAALIGLLISCRDPANGQPNDINNPEPNPKPEPNPNTVIVFDNTQGICTAVVYDDYRRRDEDKISEIPAGASSQEIEWTPGISVPFYFSYRINLKGISGFTLNYTPEIGKDQTAVRIDANTKTNIRTPRLEETLSSPDALLSNNSYILIQNNSSYSFQLLRGDSLIQPDNLPNSLVMSGERAQYTINPGAVSNYRLLVGADYVNFSGSLVSFEAGRVYSFVFNNGALSLTSEIELKLDNVAEFSPNKSVPQTPGAPVIIASDGLLTVHWTSVEGAEKYEVYISTTQNPPALPERTVYSSTTVLTGLYNRTIYYVWIKAVNENGSSDFSPRARGIPWPVNEVPAIPGRPMIIPGINQLTVSWEETGGASSYEVYINTTPSAPVEPVTTSDKTSALINYLGDGNILENGVIYYIWVRAVNNAGKSNYSPVEAGTPRIPTVAPAAPSRPVLTAGSRELSISWQAVELASAYEVWFGTSDDSSQAQKFGDDISGGITETVITGMVNETTYYVWIKAKNVVGTSGFSLPANARPSAFMALPETPAAPSIIDGNRELFVSWPEAEGALFYEIWTGTINNPANSEKYGADISGTSVTLTDLNNGTTYYIWLKSKNNIGTSGFSPMANGIPTASAAMPPDPSTAPTVTAGSGQLIISWQAVEGAASYELWVGTTNNPATASKRGNDVSSTSVTITGLNNGTTYYIWLKAKNSVGISDFSPVASGTPSAFLGTPQAPAAPSLSVGNGQISVSWTAVEGTTAYEVWLGTVNNTASAIKQGADISSPLTTTISGLSNGTTYYIWLKAKNNTGSSGFSSASFGKPIGTPGTPTISSGYKRLLVSWTNVAGAEQYDVYYGTGTPTTLAATTSGTSAAITGLTGGTTYNVRLRAKNSTGVSDYGPSASGVPVNELSPGLYRNNARIGNQNLSSSLSYVSANAVSGDDYCIVLGANESASPMNLNYSDKNVGITLLGYGGERKITLVSNGSLFTINAGVTLTLDENIALMGINTNSDSLVRVNTNGFLIMNGGIISGNTIIPNGYTTYGGGIYVIGGTVTMHSGKIIGNTNTGGFGGGIFVNSGIINIYGGTISGNTTSSWGGGIYVIGGTVTMNGGSISGNTANSGGGIAFSDTTFNMHGGAISGNTAEAAGGGVRVAFNSNSSTFRKTPIVGGQNSGIIYGNEETGVDTNGIPLKNTASNSYGHSVNSSSGSRNTTAGQTDHIDSTTGRGLSANGNAPYGE